MKPILAALAEIGMKAIAYQQAVQDRLAAVRALSVACADWEVFHRENMDDPMERHSPEWTRMLDACDREVQAIRQAKLNERRARDRMLRACRRAG